MWIIRFRCLDECNSGEPSEKANGTLHGKGIVLKRQDGDSSFCVICDLQFWACSWPVGKEVGWGCPGSRGTSGLNPQP